MLFGILKIFSLFTTQTKAIVILLTLICMGFILKTFTTSYVDINDVDAVKKYVESSPEKINEMHQNVSLLHRACYTGNLEVVQYLVEKGADINQRSLTDTQYNPLEYASVKGFNDIIAFLIENGSDVQSIEPTLLSQAIHFAAMNNNTNTIEQLIAAGSDVNSKAKNGTTPLILASHYGYVDIINCLIKNGALNNICDDDSNYPIHFGIDSNNAYSVTKALVEPGCDLNVKNKNGSTAIQKACLINNEQVVYLLHKNGATLNLCLNRATYKNNINLVRFFLDNGANVNEEDSDGNTPLSLALALNFDPSTESNCDDEIIELLIEKGADVNYQYFDLLDENRERFVPSIENERETAFAYVQSLLHWVVTQNQGETSRRIATLLLENGADITFNYDGVSIIERAREIGDEEMVNILLKYDS
jgi:ankyrin repeat protein